MSSYHYIRLSLLLLLLVFVVGSSLCATQHEEKSVSKSIREGSGNKIFPKGLIPTYYATLLKRVFLVIVVCLVIAFMVIAFVITPRLGNLIISALVAYLISRYCRMLFLPIFLLCWYTLPVCINYLKRLADHYKMTSEKGLVKGALAVS